MLLSRTLRHGGRIVCIELVPAGPSWRPFGRRVVDAIPVASTAVRLALEGVEQAQVVAHLVNHRVAFVVLARVGLRVGQSLVLDHNIVGERGF